MRKDTLLFVSYFPDFGSRPTLTVCDTEWAHTVVVVVIIVVDVAGRRNNGLTERNLNYHLFLSLVLHLMVIYLISETILDQYSILPVLMMFSL